MAIGEAWRWRRGQQIRFAIGSGENSVLLHQTVIGREAIAQMDQLDEFPDCVIACMGAGSNFAGVALPFLGAAQDREGQSGSLPPSPPRARS